MSFFKPLPGDSQEEWEREMREAEAGRMAFVASAAFPRFMEERRRRAELSSQLEQAEGKIDELQSAGRTLTPIEIEKAWARLAGRYARSKYPNVEPSKLPPRKRTGLIKDSAKEFVNWLDDVQPKPNGDRRSEDYYREEYRAAVARRLLTGEY